mmetsp:Transcript_1420/g.3800  ORF Transcript_1420/g.3800 Transcript_1420/m.3800 type:complete len:203 (-) Transcript_1420:62-670(-)
MFAKTSKIAFSTSPGSRVVGRSTLLITTMGFILEWSNAFCNTNFVCVLGPSTASTRRTTPSTMDSTRSTSPPKSAWPGVSTMLNRKPSQLIRVAFDRIVMPRSCSRSLLSIMRSVTFRPMPLCFIKQSTSVVLPWSTCAMMATLRIFSSVGASVTAGPSAKARRPPVSSKQDMGGWTWRRSGALQMARARGSAFKHCCHMVG